MALDTASLVPLYVSDAREHLEGMETAVVGLESAGGEADRRALLDELFRHLHSIKGGAAMLQIEPVSKLAHLGEELVIRVIRGKVPADAALVDLLLATRDGLSAMVERIALDEPVDGNASLLWRLGRAVAEDESGLLPGASAATADLPRGMRVTVHIDPRSALPAARALLSLRRLGALGTIAGTSPDRATIMQGALPSNILVVVMEGAVDQERVRSQLARVPDVVRVEVSDHETPPAPSSGDGAERLPTEPRTSLVPSAEQWVRVKMDLLDELLELSSELVLASSRLRERTRRLAVEERDTIENEADRLRLLVKQMSGRVLAARQAPVRHLADRLPRALRDLSRRLDRPLTLAVEGAETTLDRGLLESLTDPLLHVLRNCADHGIESPEERRRAGKPVEGRLVFAARRERDRVEIEIRDDGRGFDLVRLRRKAVEIGALSPAEADLLPDEGALRLAFLPGMSTRSTASEISGRGVGMDAVERAIEQLGGTVLLSSTPGKGSCVRFVLPATVSVVNLLLVGIAEDVYGIPLSRVVALGEGEPRRHEDGTMRVSVGGEQLPAHPLGRLLERPFDETPGVRPHLLVESAGRRAALGVDRVVGQEEAVLRPLARPFDRIRGLAGTAILGSGRPVVVLDLPKLVA